MRTLFLIAALAFSPSARADVSDVGSLTIGGNGVIGGTMTVQGRAFSVGGSSFTIGGGSAALAYQFIPGSINMTGSSGTFVNQSSVTAAAFFGDGSHLNGIASTFTGGVVANQTTFQSTVTVQGNAFSIGVSTFVVTGGNVGIGTTSPSQALEVAGRIQSDNSFNMTTSTGLVYLWNQNRFGIGYGATLESGGQSPFQILTNVNQPMYLGADGILEMTFATNGNVGILTTNPVNAFQVGVSTIGSYGKVIAVKQAGTDAYGFVSEAKNSDAFVRLGHNGTEGILGSTYNQQYGFTPLSFQTSDVDKMTILPNGNVGIGTTNPLVALQINNPTASGTYGQLIISTSVTGLGNGSGSYLAIGVANTNSSILSGDTAGDSDIFAYRNGGTTNANINFSVNGAVQMQLNKNGYFGIGTTNPTNPFEVDASKSGAYVSEMTNTHGSTGDDVLVMGTGPNSSDTSSKYLGFYDSGYNTIQGYVARNGSGAVQYITASDRRIKKIWVFSKASG